MATETAVFVVKTRAFKPGGHIPRKYTCDGENISPPLEIHDVPANTRSLAIIVEDPDAPRGTFYHWLMWNIPPTTSSIHEGATPGTTGKNGFGKYGYAGPCPPSGTHRYFFKIYALDKQLDLEQGAGEKGLKNAMRDHILAEAEVMGQYQKR